MKYLILFLISLSTFAAYNPKWVSIRTVDTIDVSQDVYAVCKDSSTLIKLEFQFQDVEQAEGMTIDWEIGALNGTSTALSPGHTYSQPLDLSIYPADVYEAVATIGGQKIIVDFNARFWVVEIALKAVNNVQTDMYKAFEVDIKPYGYPRDVDFTISKDNGTAGAAEFKTGGQTKTLTGPVYGKQYVFIKGSVVSIPADTNFPQNMHLTASIDGDDCDFEDFEIVDCAAVFAGVTFNIDPVSGIGTDELDAMDIVFNTDGNGYKRVIFQGVNPVNWSPKVTITAPNNTKASEFEVGLVQVYAKAQNVSVYENGTFKTETTQTPVKDGVPPLTQTGAPTPGFDDLYLRNNGAVIYKQYTATGEVANLSLDDIPSEFIWVNNYEDPYFPYYLLPSRLKTITIRWDFVTLVVVRHKDGCLKAIKHIKWHTDWSTTIVYKTNGDVDEVLTVSTTDDAIIDANGNGSEPFIEGTVVANDILDYEWSN